MRHMGLMGRIRRVGEGDYMEIAHPPQGFTLSFGITGFQPLTPRNSSLFYSSLTYRLTTN
jgi:hypothetical protein